MKTRTRLGITIFAALAGIGMFASSAAAAPATPAPAPEPAAVSQASNWYYWATYADKNTCDYVGFLKVLYGEANGSTCYARSYGYDLYLLA